MATKETDQFIPKKDWREFVITFRNLEADTANGFDWINCIKDEMLVYAPEYVRDLLAIHTSIQQNVRKLRQILNDDIYYIDLH